VLPVTISVGPTSFIAGLAQAISLAAVPAGYRWQLQRLGLLVNPQITAGTFTASIGVASSLGGLDYIELLSESLTNPTGSNVKLSGGPGQVTPVANVGPTATTYQLWQAPIPMNAGDVLQLFMNVGALANSPTYTVIGVAYQSQSSE